MADKSYLTKCPHCDVKFQISLSQMKMAGGAVRCGSCLEVFQANENIVQPGATPAATPTPEKPQQAAIQEQDEDPDAWAEDLLDELDEPGEQIPENPALELEPAPAAASGDEPQWAPSSSAATNDTKDNEPQWAPPPTASTESDQPAWAPPPEAGRDPVPANKTAISLGEHELDDALLDISAADNSASTAAPEKAPPANALNQDDLLDDFSLEDAPGLGEDEPELKLESALELEAEEPESESEEMLDDDMDGLFGDLDSDALAGIDELTETADQDVEEEFDFGENDAAADLGDEFDFLNDPDINEGTPSARTTPISLDIEDGTEGIDFKETGKWAGLTTAAIVLLFIQSLTFNFEDNSREQRYLGIYKTVCSMFGCNIPSRIDIPKIQGANLVVREHAEFEDALSVDAIVYNRASHDQPFPILELSFTNINGILLAKRKFLPGEYLNGELRKLKLMPNNVPVYLSLDIVNPGPDAVSYVIQFYPPENS